MKKEVINERVRAVRLKLKMSQEDFSSETGISNSLLSKIETGDSPVSNSVIAKICMRWAVNESYFETGDENGMFFGIAPLYKGTENSNNPWKDMAFKKLEEEVKFYRDLLIQITGGKSFLNHLNQTGLHKSKRLGAAA